MLPEGPKAIGEDEEGTKRSTPHKIVCTKNGQKYDKFKI